MSWKTKLEKILGDYPGGGVVDVTDDGKLATITSESFQGLGEAERQAKVWGFLQEHCSDEELVRLDFVFTNAPGDHAEAA